MSSTKKPISPLGYDSTPTFPRFSPVGQVTPALDDGGSVNRQRANGRRPSSPGSSPTRVCHLIDEADGWDSAATQKQPATVSKLLTLQHLASLSEESREATIARCVLLRAAPAAAVHSQQGWQQQPASRGESLLSDAAIKDALTMAYSTMGSGGAAPPFVILQVCMASGAWTGKEGDAPSSSSSSSPPPIAARLLRALIGLGGVAAGGPGMAVAQLLSPGWEQGRAREVDLPDQIGEKKCH